MSVFQLDPATSFPRALPRIFQPRWIDCTPDTSQASGFDSSPAIHSSARSTPAMASANMERMAGSFSFPKASRMLFQSPRRA
jgi:hypothetical protein